MDRDGAGSSPWHLELSGARGTGQTLLCLERDPGESMGQPSSNQLEILVPIKAALKPLQ